MMNNRPLVIAAITVATAIKVCLAIFTVGTNDVLTWQSFVANIHKAGDATVYGLRGIYGDPFNHPPFMIHVLLVLDWISRKTHLSFPFLLRFPAITADIGTLFLIYRMQRIGVLKTTVAAIVALALCPISILISGFHGNTDSVLVFFIVASVYLLLVKQSEWAAGLAFGMAINIKVVPIILVAVFALNIKTWRARFLFFVSAALIVMLCSLPYLAQAPSMIIKGTLFYGGFPAAWGLSNFLHAAGLSNAWRVITFVTVLAAPFWMYHRRVDLYTQIGVVFFLFLLLTPSFGVQYLAWPVPFILSFALSEVLAYYCFGGFFMFFLYHYWSGGQWYFAESHRVPAWNLASVLAAAFCWVVIGFALYRYRKMIADGKDVATS